MNAYFAVNSVIEWNANESNSANALRVLWIDNFNKNVVTISLSDRDSLPTWRTYEEIANALENGEAIRRTVDPLQRVMAPESKFLDKHRERWEVSWKIIENLVSMEPEIYDKKLRGKLIRLTAEETGVQKKTIYKYLKKYWIGGKTRYSLLPDYDKSGGSGKKRVVTEGTAKRGRPSRRSRLDETLKGINVNDDHRRIFNVATHRFYDTKQKRPLRHAYNLMIGEYFNIGYQTKDNVKVPVLPDKSQYPTFEQYKYWFEKEFNLTKTVTARVGETKFALHHRSVLGNSTTMAPGPGSIFQIDATIGDVYLVSSFDRSRIIGRPVIYFVIDVFSRMIVGFHVGLEGPSWVGAMLAILNAAKDKKTLCSEYDIHIEENEWPSNNLPKAILADRGEMLSKASDQLVSALGIKVLNTPPFRADWKGIVEQSFRLANLDAIHWLPGSTQGRMRERGEPDYRLDATLDLREFIRIVIKIILSHNQFNFMSWYQRDEDMIRDQVEPIPLNLWKWGISHRSGYLTQMSENALLIQLLPRDTATITFRGIRFRGMYYSCERAIQEQWFEQARMRGSRKMTASFDPRSIDIIYLHLDDYGNVESCRLLERESRYKGRQMEEVLELFEMEKDAKDEFSGDKMQAQAILDSEISQIVQEAKQKTQSANPEKRSKRERTANIRSNRREEIDHINNGTKLGASKDLKNRPNARQSIVSVGNTESKQYDSARNRDLEILKKLRPQNIED